MNVGAPDFKHQDYYLEGVLHLTQPRISKFVLDAARGYFVARKIKWGDCAAARWLQNMKLNFDSSGTDL